MKKISVLFALLSIVFCLTSCGGSGGDAGGGGSPTGGEDRVLASVKISDGNSQTATVGTELANPLVALLLNKTGSPIAGLVVNFRVATGGGSVFAGAALSDTNGIVRERWTLGTVAGPQKVEVRAVDSSGAAVVFATFDAIAVAGAPHSVSIASGNSQSAVQLQQLPLPVKVVVKDEYENPTAGATVTFQANNGGVAFPGTTTTNAAGEAAAVWTLGIPLGVQTLDVVGTGFAPISFSATATRAPATAAVAITKIWGDLQTIVQHTTGRWSLVVRVIDVLGNGVPGESVTFSAVPASGYVQPVTATTGGDGLAQGDFGYVHTSGQLQIVASDSALPSVIFTVNVTPNAHLYDGKYTGTAPTFTLSNGIGIPSTADAHSFTLNEADGTITFVTGWNSPTCYVGQIVVDSLQNATAAGTYAKFLLPGCAGHSIGDGTWANVRE